MSVHCGAGFRLRLILGGWTLAPLAAFTAVQGRSPSGFVTALALLAALWPVTARSGEIPGQGDLVLVGQTFRFVLPDPDELEAAAVTPFLFRRQSLVLKLKRALCLLESVSCRRAPGSVWADRNFVSPGGGKPR